MTSYVLCKTGSLAVFKVTTRDQGHYKGPSGAFVTYCDISKGALQLYHEKRCFARRIEMINISMQICSSRAKFMLLTDSLVPTDFPRVRPSSLWRPVTVEQLWLGHSGNYSQKQGFKLKAK